MKAFPGEENGGFKVLGIKTFIHFLGILILYFRNQRKQSSDRQQGAEVTQAGSEVLQQLWGQRVSSKNQAALTNSSQ